MLDEKEIEQYLNEKGVGFRDESSIVGVIMPNKITYFAGENAPLAAAMCTQYYAINISSQGVAVIGIDNVTGKLRPEAFLYISRDKIQKVQFAKNFLSYQMEIITANGSIGFRVNKTMVGAPWHKKNLGKIISAGGGRTAILPAMSYVIDIVMVIIIFLFILTIIINILNYRIVKRRHYMVALIAENARVGSYTDEFDERYRRIAEEITTLKEEQIEARRKKKLADSYEQRLKDMDSFLEKQTCQISEFDNDLVRRLIASIKVVSAEKLIIQFQSGIVMEQEIRYE